MEVDAPGEAVAFTHSEEACLAEEDNEAHPKVSEAEASHSNDETQRRNRVPTRKATKNPARGSSNQLQCSPLAIFQALIFAG